MMGSVVAHHAGAPGRGGASRPWRLPIICGIGMLLLAGCAPRLGDTEADRVLEDLVVGAGPSRLKQQTPTPVQQAFDYQVEGRRYRADLYRSPEGSLAGMVLVPGVVPQGKDDPRLVALARTLARLRFTVLVPELPGLRRYQVRRHDVRAVADAFVALTSLTDPVPPGRAGIAGISYGAGPVLLAGLEPDVRERLGFILTLGGYYDLHSVVTFFTTGYYRDQDGDAWRHKPVSPYAAWVFTLSNLELLEEPADRRRLRDHLHALAYDEAAVAAPTGLAPDAQALLALLHNRNPDRVPALIDGLSPRIRWELAGLNPAARDLSGLQAELILVHGRADNIIPYTESIALERALPPGQARLFLIDGFAHVDVQVERQDIPRLRRAVQALLEQRVSP